MTAVRAGTSRPVSPRYFLASIALLLVLVVLHTTWAIRRNQQELVRQLHDKGQALAGALEAGSRSAIQGDALMEEMIAQRLLDNARLIDQLLSFPPFDPAELPRLAAMNRLRRVDLLDRDGAPYPLSSLRPAGPRGMMRGMMMMPGAAAADPGGGPGPDHPMRAFMWGRRWGGTAQDPDAVPPAVQDRKFWEGSLLGVAVGARSFPGIIAVHADAGYVLEFRKELGVERQIAELGRQAGVESIALLAADGSVIAHSDPRRAGNRETDGAAARAPSDGGAAGRLVRGDDGGQVFEVVRPIALAGAAPGALRLRLSAESMEQAWRRDRDAGVLLGLAVVALGVVGLAAIFYAQHRRLAEVRHLEAAMAQRERLATLGDMAATVAHEIRNPLNAVSMGLQRLGAEFHPAEGEEYGRLVTLMRGEVERLNSIVGEFLSLARPLSLNREAADVADLLADAAALVEADAKASGVEVSVEVRPGLPRVRLDRDRFKQALLNVMLNAVQAMPGGGRLGVQAAVAGRHLAVTVTDAGGGIPADLLPRIFEPYVTTRAKGLGLGLAVARRIVEAHGGRIEAESEPGRGSRFRLTVPLADPPVA
jgi:two-component system sensor histidine kinase HydH